MKKVIGIFLAVIFTVLLSSLIYVGISSVPNKFYLNHKEVNMHLGENIKLILSQGKNDLDASKISWESENSLIVEVDDEGNLTPINFGTTTICAKYSNATLTCKVNVLEIVAKSITLEYQYSAISVGETQQVTAVITPTETNNKSINWSSSEPTVASIDQNGLITGLVQGTTTITARTINNLTASFNLIVEQEIEYSSFNLENTALSMNINSSKMLQYTAKPQNAVNKTITWESSNYEIVEVDQTGKVTAKKVGTATITATTSNGLQSKCNVDVPAVQITGFQIIQESINSRKIPIGGSYQIKYNVLPSNTTTEYFIKFTCNIDKSYTIVDGQIVVYSVSVSDTGLVRLINTGTSDTTGLYPMSIIVTATVVDKYGNNILHDGNILSDSIELFASWLKI